MTVALLGFAGAVAVAAILFALRQRHRAEHALREAEEEREHSRTATEAGEAFFDLASHELRSPLSAILGYHELLSEGAYGQLPDGARHALDRIGTSATHLLHLIDGLVELARLRTGAIEPHRDDVDLAVFLAGVAETFGHRAGERGIEAVSRLPDRLPTIETDRERLVRALDLLITSAIKHPADSRLNLDIDAGPDAITLSLHEIDIRIHSGADDSALRLGLRLEIVDRVARLLGGSLILEPEGDDHVRRLHFTLPL